MVKIRICGCYVHCTPCIDLIEDPVSVQRQTCSTPSGWATLVSIWSQWDDCWLPPSWSLCYGWRLPTQHLGHGCYRWRRHSSDGEKCWIRNSIERLSHKPRFSVARWHRSLPLRRRPMGWYTSVLRGPTWQHQLSPPEDRGRRTLHWVQVSCLQKRKKKDVQPQVTREVIKKTRVTSELTNQNQQIISTFPQTVAGKK